MYLDSSEDDEPPIARKTKPSNIPAPPPPPPPDATVAAVLPPRNRPRNADQMYGTTKSTADLMNAELKLVLETFRKQRPHLDIQKTPDVYIDQQSSPKEVQSWLDLKGFNKRIMKQFDGVNGEKLFALDKSQLEEYCGAKEGARLASQITVQRNVSGYKTARSSELKQILARQRNRVDLDKVDGGGSKSTPPKTNNKMENSNSSPLEKVNKMLEDSSAIDNDANSKAEKVEKDFEFLSGYQTDSDSEDDLPVSGRNPGTNTLKEQIKKQRKKIINQSNYDKASR
ncbi:hypothetical protein Pmani_033776 [Petrolisthes manimaculis]|uniref:SAM domain-containing protein n=1 Tax=Petrolisthes manimaculis TaxID=1843537 RepID=A0AAE1NQ90_9EUCA|nr:hypothetical protein Pmani_035428 [Petrolisthes manimaculis]KAK4293531.1 hypothetical protein Pmani_033776 [Petrolisthes manimaculis]